MLDPALLRVGRFDRPVLVDRPDLRDRIEILKVHGRKIHLASETGLATVAAWTPRRTDGAHRGGTHAQGDAGTRGTT
jgi:cell division protease FtsH